MREAAFLKMEIPKFVGLGAGESVAAPISAV